MRTIRTITGLLVVGTLVLSAGPTGRAEEPASRSSPSTTIPAAPPGPREQALEQRLKDLAARNLDLERENRRLKARVRELESRGRVPGQPPRRTVPVPAPRSPGEPAVPRYWIPREFNGETFYLIPLKSRN